MTVHLLIEINLGTNTFQPNEIVAELRAVIADLIPDGSIVITVLPPPQTPIRKLGEPWES